MYAVERALATEVTYGSREAASGLCIARHSNQAFKESSTAPKVSIARERNNGYWRCLHRCMGQNCWSNLCQSLTIFNALPFTDATREVIDAKAIAKMKKTAVFVNVGRGKTVDEAALIKRK